jgi:hypothetical protein
MATFHWYESNGAGESETADISNINFGSADSPNLVTASNKILKGENSFSKYIRVLFTGTWTTISNMLFWKSAGAYVAGESIKAAANATYATPSQVATGDSDIPITEGAALAINSAEGDPTIEYGVSGYSGYVRLQLQTTGSTPVAPVNQKTFTFQYDSI